MKKIIYLLLIVYSVNSYAQDKMSERRAMKEKHIDFTKEYLWFELSGLMEINGHIFKNDTSSCPIIYTANLDGITIKDCNGKVYKKRNCNKKGCSIIHLQPKNETVVKFNDFNVIPWEEDRFNYLYGDTLIFSY
jgi:hypothetical protein